MLVFPFPFFIAIFNCLLVSLVPNHKINDSNGTKLKCTKQHAYDTMLLKIFTRQNFTNSVLQKHNAFGKIRAHRAHTPRAMEHCWWSSIEHAQDSLVQARAVVSIGMIWHRRGYDGQQKGTICDARGSCPSIWSILKPVFRQVRLIRCTYESLRCLDVEIWRFLCGRQTTDDRQTDCLTPAAHERTRGNNLVSTGKGRHFFIQKFVDKYFATESKVMKLWILSLGEII
jgi:hypothetical protein